MQINSTEKENLNGVNELITTQVNSGENGVKSYGKFNSVESLLNAYNSLQAEFTRRCQRVKELERELNVVKTNDGVLKPTVKANEENFVDEKSVVSADYDNKELEFNGELYNGNNELNDELKQKIIREYLNGIKSSKPKIPLTSGNGTAIISPPAKPKNLIEAGELAKQILLNKEIY